MGMRRINGTSAGYSVFISLSRAQLVQECEHCEELAQVWVENEGISAFQAGSKKSSALNAENPSEVVPP